ncbi:preprotein translocase subunit SecG [Xinfangfangia pollutisoli]|uniref:preprotein translocase subunit SecG n=1 Tax=Xinfangfangia pollutisoli TaxID=2865960 RepID=UPI001CD463AA|nr:preprotein translocase subunit SecG [Xinfangfangia pollutisoli]
METVILTIHLILALLLIGVVLLQKNEGGALLSGGGNMQARGQATALTKLTWIFAAAFIVTSITLTVMTARGSGGGSVLDRAPAAETPAGTETPAVPPLAPSGSELMPPAQTDGPAVPPAGDAAVPPAGEAAPASEGTADPAAPPAEEAPKPAP